MSFIKQAIDWLHMISEERKEKLNEPNVFGFRFPGVFLNTGARWPWHPRGQKRPSSVGWGLSRAALVPRLRPSWTESGRRTLTCGGRLMSWPSDTSSHPTRTRASCWRWAQGSFSACSLLRERVWIVLSMNFFSFLLCLACTALYLRHCLLFFTEVEYGFPVSIVSEDPLPGDAAGEKQSAAAC